MAEDVYSVLHLAPRRQHNTGGLYHAKQEIQMLP